MESSVDEHKDSASSNTESTDPQEITTRIIRNASSLSYWNESVKKHWRQTYKEYNQTRAEELKRLLKSKRDQVIKKYATTVTAQKVPFRLDGTSDGTLLQYDYGLTTTTTANNNNSKKRSLSQVRTLQHAGPILGVPRHDNPVALDRNFSAQDTKELEYVPSFMERHEDDRKSNAIFDLHQLERRNDRIMRGSVWKADTSTELINSVLSKLWKDSGRHLIPWDSVLSMLVDIGKLSPEHVRETFETWKVDNMFACRVDSSNDECSSIGSNGVQLSLHAAISSTATNTKEEYLDFADSYRKLFCRRCFVYDCNFHSTCEKADLTLQTQLALQKEERGHWNKDNDMAIKDTVKDIVASDPFSHVTELTKDQKVLASQIYIIANGNFDEMSVMMRVPAKLLEAHFSTTTVEMPPPLSVTGKKERKANFDYFSVRNYQQSWYKNAVGAAIHPFYEPCCHSEPCSEETCSCIKNAFFCTKACIWGAQSPNFFRGCNCQGRCTLKSCTCVANNRECDPDLCQCGNPCCDPPGAKVVSQRCLNDNISMNRRAHILVGQSGIEDAGLGCYTKYKLLKGEFVEEYLGELISQEEAERRGQLYDIEHKSSLFNYTSDHVIDASRKANKARFINHSSTPNLDTRTIFVNGDYRIGFFANRDIEEQEELFFDYKYNSAIDNDLLHKPAREMQWMNSKEAASAKPATKQRSGKSRQRKRK